MVMWKSAIVWFSSRKFQIQLKFQCNYLIQYVLYNTSKISDPTISSQYIFHSPKGVEIQMLPVPDPVHSTYGAFIPLFWPKITCVHENLTTEWVT